jgi:hypothetical protein
VVEGQWTSAFHQLKVVGLPHGKPEFPPPVMIPLCMSEAITWSITRHLGGQLWALTHLILTFNTA